MILRDIKVLDFTRLLPGPLAASWMVQAGAEVLKIEDKNRPDGIHTFSSGMFENAHLYEALNFGKKVWSDFALDELSSQLEFIEKLKTADVLLEQFKPGLMDKLGLGYEALKSFNPRLIYISLSGFGSERPEPAHDINFVAEAGLLHLIRDENGKPVLPEFQLGDVSGSYACYNAVLEGLIHRFQSGEGCYKDISMTAAVLPFALLAFRFADGGIPQAGSFLAGAIPNYNVYRCADGEYIALGALEYHLWMNVCKALEMPLELHSAFNNPDMKKQISDFFEKQPVLEWVRLSEGKNTCISRVCRPADSYYREINSKNIGNTEKGIRYIKSPFS